MALQERILCSLSSLHEEEEEAPFSDSDRIAQALNLLEGEFPGFAALVSGKRVVDFGCKFGFQSMALVEKYGCTVIGIDINRRYLQRAECSARHRQIPAERLRFVEHAAADLRGTVDVVISQNSFEHFSQPVAVLAEMKSLLTGQGTLLITFGPPWYAPYGSHMQFFCRVPWLNLFFSEQAVMKVRANFREDGAQHYEQVESGLNRMTVGHFEQIIAAAHMEIGLRHYTCVHGLNLLAKLPLVRELLITHASVVLTPH